MTRNLGSAGSNPIGGLIFYFAIILNVIIINYSGLMLLLTELRIFGQSFGEFSFGKST